MSPTYMVQIIDCLLFRDDSPILQLPLLVTRLCERTMVHTWRGAYLGTLISINQDFPKTVITACECGSLQNFWRYMP
jgi:hypothetical protein